MSTLPPECEQLLVSGYVLGNLSSAEALLFEEMMAENPSLKQQVREMQAALDLAYNPEEISPPPQLRDRILNAANAEITSSSNEKNITTSKAPISKHKIIAAIALGTIAILSWSNYRLWQNLKIAEDADKLREKQTYLLSGENLDLDSTAKLVVDGDRLNATLAVNNLPPLPPGKVYALWTVVGKDIPYTTDDKGAILTAVFQVDETGDFRQEIAVPQPHLEPRLIQKIAITIEDIADPQAHRGGIFISTGN